MPKKAEYTIAWSNMLGGYELIHSPFSYLLDTSSLMYWLDYANTFHVCSRVGNTFTLRKETKQRGGGYWYAYKRVRGRVEKKYIGEKSNVTLEKLEVLAQYFSDLGTSGTPSVPPPEPPPAPKPSPKQPVLPMFGKSLESELCIYGFPKIPTKRVLLNRYRELAKLHHPDTGGMHEDMVTVNLAYDYLKKFV